ncbi:unnamed protein product [Schistosoma curassoni]|uniref:FCP1 homology domain-containing protein n=1 Tax=Schistosoma curassoni TaxID=6186 RepID=A0A183KPH6_9TREM|nr:unnamed protein product [Schistosoma curassoni]
MRFQFAEGGISGERTTDASASIPMMHGITELHVSETVGDEIALQDEQSLLVARKLVLLVDLDQTIIHTTNDSNAFKCEVIDLFIKYFYEICV